VCDGDRAKSDVGAVQTQNGSRDKDRGRLSRVFEHALGCRLLPLERTSVINIMTSL